MLDRDCYGFDAEVIIKGLESSVDELSVVVGYYRIMRSLPEWSTSNNQP